ncbi:MAG: DNA mismatch repair endonuclease MutL [Bacteroidia bacterium]|nr:DNA mismatch repair endonuclease MutL [Bacteroidia bacterium]
MQHLIKLLPDNLANQIAAGEVVQRPASVVKELMENAVDSGADEISLSIKDAGKALVQVSDNGCGMTSQDARMSFERHATSKISTTDDLFNIRTLGFRGEALASIAAVAQVNLKTRPHDQELGTEIEIAGNDIKRQEPVLAPAGSCLTVKNLFFNVPARRNFLKSNPVETRHILNEFIRVALAYPRIAFSFHHNDSLVYDLPRTTLEERIVALFGKDLEGNLVEVGDQTPYVNIFGFIGRPEAARKARGEQFFFVNRRFIKSNYLNHAISQAFEGMIPKDKFPFYCLYIDIEPQHVDINIHPTKTEVKFDDERTVYGLMHSIVKRGLGGLHDLPRFQEEEEDESAIAGIIRNTPPPKMEGLTIGQSRPGFQGNSTSYGNYQPQTRQDTRGWEQLFETPAFNREKSEPQTERPQPETVGMFRQSEISDEGFIVQLQNRYILSQIKSGLVIIDQNFAHQRILFETFMQAGSRPPLASQQMLFPKSITFAPGDFVVIQEMQHELRHLGFDLKEFDNHTMILHGLPSEISPSHAEALFEEIIAGIREADESDFKQKLYESLARAIAVNGAVQVGKKLNPSEMRRLVDELFQCELPAVSPSGKPTYKMLGLDELAQHFQRQQG